MGPVSHPGNVSVGPDQHGGGRGNRAEHRKIPVTNIFRIDQPNPAGPWSDVEEAGLPAVQQHWPGIVQQGERSLREISCSSAEKFPAGLFS